MVCPERAEVRGQNERTLRGKWERPINAKKLSVDEAFHRKRAGW